MLADARTAVAILSHTVNARLGASHAGLTAHLRGMLEAQRAETQRARAR